MITIHVGDKEAKFADFVPGNEEIVQDSISNVQIVVGPEPVKVQLKIRKSLDDDIIIYDHELLDIVITPAKNKVATIPKRNVAFDSYPAQNRFFSILEKTGVILRGSIRSGPVHNSLLAYYPATEKIQPLQVIILLAKRFVDEEKQYYAISSEYTDDVEEMLLEPDDEDSTELGEIEQEIDQTGMRGFYSSHYYYNLRESKKNA